MCVVQWAEEGKSDSQIAGENARCVMVPVFACITGQDWGGRSDGLTLGTKLKEESRNAKFRTNSILMQYLKIKSNTNIHSEQNVNILGQDIFLFSSYCIKIRNCLVGK